MKPTTGDDQRQKESPSHSPKKHSVVKHLTQNIQPNLAAELQLLLLTFSTGIQDATTVPDYHCFSSNQTGNTIFLCLGLVLPHLNGDVFVTANIGVSLGLFLGAGWVTGQLSHIIGPRKRWWLFLCNFIQTCLVFAAAAVQYIHGTEIQGPQALSVIGLLALAAGSQVVQSRSLAMTEISTAMATAAWVDLLIDSKILAYHNRPRTRRVAFLFALVLGGFVGAFIYREVGSGTALAVSGAGKFIATVMYLFAKAEKDCDEDSVV
ncbi:unnamed protein product [Clonostachys rosea]|uniref:DUF1275 domain protein n=1 Tax=Bionectria ochroleuca TaxID=29856 RepID=A0ABY6USY2_BIOOC|nr:unnamed protein product [Clonostachys rosea]